MEPCNAWVQTGIFISRGETKVQRGEMAGLKIPCTVWVRTGTWTLGHWLQPGSSLQSIPFSLPRPLSCSFIQLLLLLWSVPQNHLWIKCSCVWVFLSLISVEALTGKAQSDRSVSAKNKAESKYTPGSPQQNPSWRAMAQSHRTSGKRSHQRCSSLIPR